MKKTLIILTVILIGIQFIPAERSNPPVTEEINTPSDIKAILKKSCYDCHSNETKYPWYAYIAPVSYFVASDVNEGRKRLNFSEWDKYDEKKRDKKLEAIIEAVEEGEMPLSVYTLLHNDAILDTARINILKEWVKPGSTRDDYLLNGSNREKD